MKIDFAKFEHSLPYASELYGVYQPLLGWRSRMRTLQLAPGMASMKRRYLQQLQFNTAPVYTMPNPNAPHDVPAGQFQLDVGQAAGPPLSGLDAVDSIVARRVADKVAAAGIASSAWQK